MLNGRDSVPLAARLSAVLPLKRLRRACGLTQQQLADEIGVSRRSVYTYESTGRVPRVETAQALALIFGLDRLTVIRLSGSYMDGGARRTDARLAVTAADPQSPLLGRNLRAAREAAGLTQRELAERLGVHRKTLQGYELGRFRPVDWLEFKKRVTAIVESAEIAPCQE
jgi:transcriptional regulator with XRE-family HTH domain